MKKVYACIDLKSFYASVECVERGLDPFQVNLVVADATRGSGAITLAATPAIKKHGIKSRGRLFEIPKGLPYMTAPPRMALYMDYAAKIYKILLRFVSSEDIYVYSIDESFIDLTPYLRLYHTRPKTLAQRMIQAIYEETGITATAGLGTNLFLAKVALDVLAKHTDDGIGALNKDLFYQTMWHHQPLTDIWMIGPGTTRRLARLGIYDLYGIAHMSERVLYKEFGINAEYLIDHAWGKEPTEIADIKAYTPKQTSVSNSQILFEDYNYENALLVLKEMVEGNVLTLCEKHIVTNHISLYIGYSKDRHKPARGSTKITNTTNSYALLKEEFVRLYKRIVQPNVPIRQIAISFGNIQPDTMSQYDLWADLDQLEKEHKMQETLVSIRKKYGKNAVLKAMSACEKATAKTRNTLIGGHHA